MCLITVCPKGTKKTINDIKSFVENGMKTNTDGSGFAYKKNGSNTVNLSKGYRFSEDLLKDISTLKLKVNDELIIHHRIGTSGLSNDINMHPFVVSNDLQLLQSTKGEFNLPVMAHNGVFHKYSEYYSNFNDTFHFVQKFMYDKNVKRLMLENTTLFNELFEDVIKYNKLAFLFPDRNVFLLGNFIEDNGYFHSNSGYKDYVFDKGGSSFFRNLQNNRIFNHKETILATDSQIEEIQDEESIEEWWEKRFPSENRTKNLSGTIRFKPNEIEINSDNYKHFWFKSSVEGTHLKINEAFEITNLSNDESLFSYIKITSSKIHYCESELEEILKNSEYLVKKEYEYRYQGLFKLVNAIKGNYSRTMCKKINKALSNNYKKDSFKFKDYGVVFNKDLKTLLKLNYEKLESVEENGLILKDFTTNETGTANLIVTHD